MQELRGTAPHGDDDGGHAATRRDIAGPVREVLAEVLGLAVSEVASDSDLESDLGMDSLKMIETNVALETRFGFVTPDVAKPEELDIRTVDDLVGYVARLVVEQRGRQ